MKETLPQQPKEEIKIQSLLDRWKREAPKGERFEYAEGKHSQGAIRLLNRAIETKEPLQIITPMCLNYETLRIDNKRYPTIHNEMVWSDRGGLRRGYLLLHEEIPHRLREFNLLGVPLQHLIIVVDIGMSKQLFTDLNPDTKGKSRKEIEDHIDAVVDTNTTQVQKLITHGLQQQTIDGDTRLEVSTIRLSGLIKKLKEKNPPKFDFLQDWHEWNVILRNLLGAPNNRWAGLMREALKKDNKYFREVWGYTNNEDILERVIDENFGLTAVFGEYLNRFSAMIYDTTINDKDKVIMLDALPSPHHSGYREFYAYNLDYPDGAERKKTPILRPFYNYLLLSSPAKDVPYIDKSMDQMVEEAKTFSFDSPEAQAEIKRFSDEAKQALKEKGYIIFRLTGKSLMSMEESTGNKFVWINGAPIGPGGWDWDFYTLSSMRSEVAINPKKLFLPQAHHKTAIQQQEQVNNFSEKLKREVQGVKAVIGSVAEYAEIIFAYSEHTKKELYRDYGDYEIATNTIMSGNRSVKRFLKLRLLNNNRDNRIEIGDWIDDLADNNVIVSPLVIPD